MEQENIRILYFFERKRIGLPIRYEDFDYKNFSEYYELQTIQCAGDWSCQGTCA